MDSFWLDVRYSFRFLLRRPGFTLVAAVTLALGIGANTAIFSIVNAVLLRPLPFQDPERLVMVSEAMPKLLSNPVPFSAPDLVDFRQEQRSYESVGSFQNKYFDLSGIGQPVRLTGARISAGLPELLRAQPLIGRTFSAEEDQPGKSVVLLSYDLWQQHFGGDRDIVGKSISLDRIPHTIVGVMPAGFQFPMPGPPNNNLPARLWVPTAFTPTELQARASMFNNSVIARLAPGVTINQARSEAQGIAGSILQKYPPAVLRDLPGVDLVLDVKPLREAIVGDVRTPLLVLMTAVGLVLLIGCVNIANLLLVRACGRQKEIALFMALGAGRGRLFRRTLVESLEVALLGGALGVLIAVWIMDYFLALLPAEIPPAAEIGIDSTVLLFTILVSLLTAFIFGMAPAISSFKTDLRRTLKEGTRTASSGASRGLMRHGLVVLEICLALVLLVSAGLLLRSFLHLINTNPGFQPDRVLSLSVPAPRQAYPEAGQIRSFYRLLLEKVRNLPGITKAGIASDLPVHSSERRVFYFEVRPWDDQSVAPTIAQTWTLGNYFETLGIPLRRGRLFTERDDSKHPLVVIINETMARRFWPAEDPIGRRIKWGGENPWMEIVGVVGDVKDGPLDAAINPHTYTPYQQEGDFAIAQDPTGMLRSLTLLAATPGDPASLATAIRGAIHSLDPELAVANVQTLEQAISSTVEKQRFNTYLLGLFAGVALFLAAIGIYGVLAYNVSERTHELGVRMALGAQRSDLVRLVLGHGVVLAFLGAGIGIVLALAATRAMTSLLYMVTSTDPMTYAVVTALVVGVTLLSSFVPARRAMKVDPISSLRYE